MSATKDHRKRPVNSHDYTRIHFFPFPRVSKKCLLSLEFHAERQWNWHMKWAELKKEHFWRKHLRLNNYKKKPYRLWSLPLSPPPSPSRRVNGKLSAASDGMGLSGLVGWTSLEDIEERMSEGRNASCPHHHPRPRHRGVSHVSSPWLCSSRLLPVQVHLQNGDEASTGWWNSITHCSYLIRTKAGH